MLTSLLALAVAHLAGCHKGNERVDLTQYLYIYPSSSIVQMDRKSASIMVVVRNVSEKKLTNLRLKVKTEAAYAFVEPKTIPRILPGDRRNFTLTLTREDGKKRGRYPLYLTLHSPDLPVPAGLDLMTDTSLPVDQRWIDVGQIKLVSQSDSRLVYYLLAGIPLLFLVGWLLWRWSRSRPVKLMDIEQ